MMKRMTLMRLKIFIFLITFGFSVNLGLAQNNSQFVGYLFSLADSLPIENALIVSSTEGKALTDINGKFELEVTHPGWIEVIHLNFTGKFALIDTFQKRFFLAMETYELEPAQINLLYDRNSFDFKFVKKQIPADPKVKIKAGLRLETVSRIPNTNGAELGSPITALYNRFSKEAKRKRIFDTLMNEVEHLKILRSWLTYKRMAVIIEQEDSSRINCFFLYCSIHPEIVTYLSEIEVLEGALLCRGTFDSSTFCDWPDDLYFLH
jgi:hypothetical protein